MKLVRLDLAAGGNVWLNPDHVTSVSPHSKSKDTSLVGTVADADLQDSCWHVAGECGAVASALADELHLFNLRKPE